ncbi:hypothetical protein DPMN_055646 [Dreissena polymorpha]|uniref:Uncharacterized protein n=1 Tax=Dreissena polymorpha TaxID=45954 RepID=A0A9D4CSS1_DREPO|nr:hypothetical protein DPMN_055646 [Dreissena polymorpha]
MTTCSGRAYRRRLRTETRPAQTSTPRSNCSRVRWMPNSRQTEAKVRKAGTLALGTTHFMDA